MTPDIRIGLFAARHHGVLSREVALRAGLTDDQISHRLASGRWTAAFRGVYLVAGSPSTWHQSLFAAIVCGGDGTVASHASAARVWGLPFRVGAAAIEVTTHRSVQLTARGFVAHRSLCLFDADRARRHGIPVTSVPRTLVDLTPQFSKKAIGLALDHALRHRLTTLESVARCVSRLEPSRGRRLSVIGQLLADRLEGYDRAASVLEDAVLRMIARSGLPLPKQNHPVTVSGCRYVLDLAWIETKIAVEVDGFAFHSTREAFDDDRARRNALQAAGWTILNVTSNSDHARFLRDLGAVLRQRQPLVGLSA